MANVNANLLKDILQRTYDAQLKVLGYEKAENKNSSVLDSKISSLDYELKITKASSPENVMREQIIHYDAYVEARHQNATEWLELSGQDQLDELLHDLRCQGMSDNDAYAVVYDKMAEEDKKAKAEIEYSEKYSQLSLEDKEKEVLSVARTDLTNALGNLVNYSVADAINLQPSSLQLDLEPQVVSAIADMSAPKLQALLNKLCNLDTVKNMRSLSKLDKFADMASSSIIPSVIIALLGTIPTIVGGVIGNDIMSNIGSGAILGGLAVAGTGFYVGMCQNTIHQALKESQGMLPDDIKAAVEEMSKEDSAPVM